MRFRRVAFVLIVFAVASMILFGIAEAQTSAQGTQARAPKGSLSCGFRRTLPN